MENTNFFFQTICKLNTAIDRAVRLQSKLAVIFLDIDNFKKVNDTFGHYIGDKLLEEFSIRLQNCLHMHESVTRFSGDEFTLFIEDMTDTDDVLSFAGRLGSLLSDSVNIEGNELLVSVSVGISVFPDDGESADELLRNADTAMRKVKESGKNSYMFFNKKMIEEMSKRLSIEKHLKKAIANNELTLHYQPLIYGKSCKIRGCEALLRWNNKEIGRVSPMEFIPVAEEMGLIAEIGEWVLRTACMKNKEWQDTYGLNMIVSVNISAVQLKQKNFIQTVQNALDDSGLDPDFLELEVTESVLIDSMAIVTDKLEAIRSMGVKIALDDFGTGYSSLNYLKNLPINTLKIDKTFVRDIKSGSKEEAIVGSIISLVHKLGLNVVAEGVEMPAQLSYLLDTNCDIFQGYLLCKPLPEDELIKKIIVEY